MVAVRLIDWISAASTLRVHHPPVADWQRQKVRNDDSLVIELRFGQVSMLLTGDIGREVEQSLIPTLDLLPIVVLKSPHHGSGTSSSEEFVETIQPRLVLISCRPGESLRTSRAAGARPLSANAIASVSHRLGWTDRDRHGRSESRSRDLYWTSLRVSKHEGHEEHEGIHLPGAQRTRGAKCSLGFTATCRRRSKMS